MKYKLVCNRCNWEYSVEFPDLTKYEKILNVKTGISLKKENVPGKYRIMNISTLPCNCTDSHWVFVKE